jgi:hypothetical protein
MLKIVLASAEIGRRGISVYSEVRLQAGDAKGIEHVAQHIIRNTLWLVFE